MTLCLCIIEYCTHSKVYTGAVQQFHLLRLIPGIEILCGEAFNLEDYFQGTHKHIDIDYGAINFSIRIVVMYAK